MAWRGNGFVRSRPSEFTDADASGASRRRHAFGAGGKQRIHRAKKARLLLGGKQMSATYQARAASGSYFGSFVIFAAFVGMVFGPASVLVYSFGVFVGPFEQEFGWTRAQISIAASIVVFVSVLTQPLQ